MSAILAVLIWVAQMFLIWLLLCFGVLTIAILIGSGSDPDIQESRNARLARQIAMTNRCQQTVPPR